MVRQPNRYNSHRKADGLAFSEPFFKERSILIDMLPSTADINHVLNEQDLDQYGPSAISSEPGGQEGILDQVLTGGATKTPFLLASLVDSFDKLIELSC